MASDTALTLGVALAAFAFTTNVSADDTVTIGDIVYTFKAAPSAANEVDVGSDLDDSIGNLVAAINLTGTADDEWGDGTVQNPYVSAAADLTNDEIDLTARVAGSAINCCYLAATSPGGNDIVAGAVSFGALDSTPGVGLMNAFIAGLISLNQINSEVLFELKKLTTAAD